PHRPAQPLGHGDNGHGAGPPPGAAQPDGPEPHGNQGNRRWFGPPQAAPTTRRTEPRLHPDHRRRAAPPGGPPPPRTPLLVRHLRQGLRPGGAYPAAMAEPVPLVPDRRRAGFPAGVAGPGAPVSHVHWRFRRRATPPPGAHVAPVPLARR